MPNFLSDWIKAIQMHPRFLFGISLVGIIFLAAPAGLMESVGLTELRTHYKAWVAVGTLISAVFFFIQLTPILIEKLAQQKLRKARIASLSTLSVEEWVMISYCLEHNEQTIARPVTDRIASGLAARGLLVMAARGAINAAPFSIPTYIWNHLQENRSTFLENGPLTEDLLKTEFGKLHRDIRRYDD